MEEQSLELTGKRLYSPGTIAAYLILSGLPLGLFLYGLNIRRRGQTIIGTILCTLSSMTLASMLILSALGKPITGFGIIGIFAAIGIVSMEGRPYKAALKRGATRAKWWPPAIVLIGLIIIFVVVGSIFDSMS